MRIFLLIAVITSLLILGDAADQRKCFAPVYCDLGDNTGRPEWLQVFPPPKCHWTQSGNTTRKASKKIKPNKKITDEIKKDLEQQKTNNVELNGKYEDLVINVTANQENLEHQKANNMELNEKYEDLVMNVTANQENIEQQKTTNVELNKKYEILATANKEMYENLATNVTSNQKNLEQQKANNIEMNVKYEDLATNVTVNKEMYEELVSNYVASQGVIRDLTTKISGIKEQLENLKTKDSELQKTINGIGQDGFLRLVGGSSFKEGRVEIYHAGEWGTICDDYWDINEGHVLCRTLGFSKASEAPMSARFGEGSGKVWLDDIVCSGSESDFADCSNARNWGPYNNDCGPNDGDACSIADSLGKSNCNHGEDASVICE